ncbi:hypothetical protein HK105_205268 [Polyrhizophydium stewartii]|uniref:Ankyrin repeat protein n=1 Tax=Polyrhizophydium stewartii TaxID=2732419 RepID=A0ABR4N6J2_9FUNG
MSSLVDRLLALPWHIYDPIMEHAGPLTQLLHGTLPRPVDELVLIVAAAECLLLDRANLLDQVVSFRWHPWWLGLCARTEDDVGAAVEAGMRFECTAPMLARGCDVPDLLGAVLQLFDSILTAPPSLALAMQRIANEVLSISLAALDARRARLGQADDTEVVGALLQLAAGLGAADAVAALNAAIPANETRARSAAVTAAVRGGHLAIADSISGRDGRRSNAWLAGAVQGGNIPLVRNLVRNYPKIYVPADTTRRAFGFGRDDMVWWLLKNPKTPAFTRALSYFQLEAARKGRKDMLLYALDEGIGRVAHYDLLEEVGILDDLDFFKKIHDKLGCQCRELPLNVLAKCGAISVLKWVCSHANRRCRPYDMSECAEQGHLELYLWMYAQGVRVSHDEMFKPACAKQFWIVEHLITHGHDDLTELWEWVMGDGDLLLFDLMADSGRAKPTSELMIFAAKGNSVDGVRWVHRRIGGGYSDEAVVEACKRGTTKIIAALVDECGIPITKPACLEAAVNGHLHVVRWLFGRTERGLWHDVRAAAAKESQSHIVEWLDEQLGAKRQ